MRNEPRGLTHMSEARVTLDGAPAEISDRNLFLAVIAVATIGPLFFITLFAPNESKVAGVNDLFEFLLVFSTMHVALTAYFYVNREYRTHLYGFKSYYFILPVAIIILSGLAVLQFDKVGKVYLFVFYHAWLLFHYGRQNFGVLSFVGIATRGPRPLLSERIALHFAPIGGILGANALIGDFKRTFAAPFIEQSVLLGQVFTVGALLAGAVAIVHHLRHHPDWRRIAYVALLSAFYVPTFLFDNYTQAVMSYAVAHALQYFVFMYFLAAGDRATSPSRSIILLGACGMIGWLTILLMRERPFWQSLSPEADRFMIGAALGIVMCHFVVDAGVWKLSNAWFRERCFERMGFLFTKR